MLCTDSSVCFKREYAFCSRTSVMYAPSEMCIFGDRLYTDIALGKKFGVTAVLVLSGETQPEDIESAMPSDKPDFVFESLADVDRLCFE